MFVFVKDNIINTIGGAENVFSFKLWQSDANAFNTNNGYNVTLKVIDNLDENNLWKWIDDIPTGDCERDCTVLYSEMIYTGSDVPTSSESALELSSTFTVEISGQLQILLYFQLTGQPTPASGNSYYLEIPTYERKDLSRSFGSPITQSSIIVDVPVPPIVSQPSQVDCPHHQEDLVDWHDPSIWPGSVVPQPDGNDITIPENSKVLISSCSLLSGTYGTIFVPSGSELIFGDANINMTVENIHVNGGHLWIGSESCRLYSYITITLAHSDNYLPEPFGRKGITSTNGGIIDMHGKLYQNTWSRLASPAFIEDDRILLMDDVNWEVGQQVVIVTSIWEDHWNPQNEVKTIAAIDGRVVQFTDRIEYYHYAGEEYQSEVGLLSRRILIQGDEISETQTPHVGGHILSNGEIARISGVQAYRMGQTNVLAKYPFHFHMMHESPESYFQDCSVYHSYYRCYTVHGTNSTRLSRNVAFDVLGHCFYIEDGVEEHNTFEYNLAVYPQPLFELNFYENGYGQDGITIVQNDSFIIPADGAVSGFYVSNANNYFYGNTASGGFAGFSIINFPAPIGNHKSSSMVPEQRPLAQFYGNTAHSSSYQWNRGGCVYTGGDQYYNEEDLLVYNVGRNSRNTLDDGEEVWMRFLETRVFLCTRGLNHWGNRAEAIGFAAHDVARGLTLFGEALFADGVVDARSGNPLQNPPFPQQAFQYYDISVKTILDNIEFKNLYENEKSTSTTNQNAAIISMTHSDQFKPQGINAARGLTFTNVWEHGRISNTIRTTGASRYYNIIDWDGSLLDNGVPSILGSANNETYSEEQLTPRIKEWWNLGPECILYPEYTMYSCPKSVSQEIVNIFFDVHMLTNDVTRWPWSSWPGTEVGTNVGTVSQFGYTSDEDRRSTIITTNPGITGVSGDNGWYVNLDEGTPQEFFIRARQIPYTETNTHFIFAMKFPTGIDFDISTDHQWDNNLKDTVVLATSFEEMYNDPEGLSYFLVNSSTPSEQWLFMKVINRHYNADNAEDGYFERRGIKVYNVNSFYWYRIATCSTADIDGKCPSYTSSTTPPFWSITDEVPPFVSSFL